MLLLTDYVAIGCKSVDEIHKLRGCYLVIFDPAQVLGPLMLPILTDQCQWMLDDDCQGFKFAPPKLYHPYLTDKKQNHPPEWYWCAVCDMGHRTHVGRCTKTSADLFVAMTNYVSYHHETDDDMIPSPHLKVEITKDKKLSILPRAAYRLVH